MPPLILSREIEDSLLFAGECNHTAGKCPLHDFEQMPYSITDFVCECECGLSNISCGLYARMNLLAFRVGDPPRIIRGFYCTAFRSRAPGYEVSRHTDGLACDIAVYGQYFRHAVLREVFNLFPVVVVYPRYVHLEIPKESDQYPVCHVY